jgi:hypothetical protein
MTKGSNSVDGESQQPERDASASSTTPSEPVQLDLFQRRTGDGGWIKETPYESKPSRDFISPPATDTATDGRSKDKCQPSSKSSSAPLSKDDTSRSGGAK